MIVNGAWKLVQSAVVVVLFGIIVFQDTRVCASNNSTATTNINYKPATEPSDVPLPIMIDWCNSDEKMSNFDMDCRRAYVNDALRDFSNFIARMLYVYSQNFEQDRVNVFEENGYENVNMSNVFRFCSRVGHFVYSRTFFTLVDIEGIGRDLAAGYRSSQESTYIVPFISLKRGVKLRVQKLASDCNCPNIVEYIRYLLEHAEFEIGADTRVAELFPKTGKMKELFKTVKRADEH